MSMPRTVAVEERERSRASSKASQLAAALFTWTPSWGWSGLAEVGRYSFRFGDDGLVRYWLEHLFVPHGYREWLWRLFVRVRLAWRAPRSGAARDEVTQPSFVTEALEELAQLPAAGIVSTSSGPLRWIALKDYPRSERGRLALFLFGSEDRSPRALLKLRTGDTGEPLGREWEALRSLRRALPPELSHTLPEPLAYGRRGDKETLLMSALGGRSIDFEMGRRPLGEGVIANHLGAVATWLARFHVATRRAGASGKLEEEVHTVRDGLEKDGERYRREPLDELESLEQERWPELSASHGDFWSRNVLVRNGSEDGDLSARVVVIDWEHFSAKAPPFDDLFHFASSYALLYPRAPYRLRHAADALRHAFLSDGLLARCLRSYFETYSREAGVRPETLKPFFHLFLLKRSLASCREGSFGPFAPRRRDWLELHCALAESGAPSFPEDVRP